MANASPVPEEGFDFDSLLDYVQKGKLRALQDWLNTGKPIRSPDDPKRAADLLRTAVNTGFHSMVEELLHAGGWSPSELADAIDLARSLKRDDIAELILECSASAGDSEGLPKRARSCLAAAGIPLDKQAVLHALRTGALSRRTPLYGTYTHRDVCHWLGIEEEEFLPSLVPREDARPLHLDNGLSYRANGLLRRVGIPVEKLTVRQAIETGDLVPGKHPYNYGKQTHAELCRWVGIEPSTPRNPPRQE